MDTSIAICHNRYISWNSGLSTSCLTENTRGQGDVEQTLFFVKLLIVTNNIFLWNIY